MRERHQHAAAATGKGAKSTQPTFLVKFRGL